MKNAQLTNRKFEKAKYIIIQHTLLSNEYIYYQKPATHLDFKKKLSYKPGIHSFYYFIVGKKYVTVSTFFQIKKDMIVGRRQTE